MRTEFDFGREYAEWMIQQGETEPVDIPRMCSGISDIPDDDYRAMVRAGIENPNAREYWRGYNNRMSERQNNKCSNIALPEKTYMNTETGSVGGYDDWWYKDEDGEAVNAVDQGEVVEVRKDESGQWVEI